MRQMLVMLLGREPVRKIAYFASAAASVVAFVAGQEWAPAFIIPLSAAVAEVSRMLVTPTNDPRLDFSPAPTPPVETWTSP